MKNIIEKIKTNKNLTIKLAIAGAAVVIIGIVILLCMPKTIDMADYVTIKTFSGYDGYGTVSYEIDTERFANDMIGDDINETSREAYYFAKEGRIRELFDITVINNGSLSNGDTVTVEVRYDSRNTFGKTINNGIVTTEVSGLTPTKNIDFFDIFDVYFYGVNSQGNIGIASDVESGLEFYLPGVTFTSENDGKLSNGDKIKVVATMEKYDTVKDTALEYGYVFEQTQEKEFTVKDLDLLMTKEDVKGEFLENIIEISKDTVVGNSIFTSFTNASVYCAEKTTKGDSETAVFVVVDFYSSIWSNCTKAVVFSDCSKSVKDGQTACHYSSYGIAELGNVLYSAIGEEEVFASLTARYPDYKITKIQ